jgi:hypothetical protein
MVKILKGLIVFPQRVNLAGAVLALFAVLVVSNNEAAFAGQGSITKATAPGPVLVFQISMLLLRIFLRLCYCRPYSTQEYCMDMLANAQCQSPDR